MLDLDNPVTLAMVKGLVESVRKIVDHDEQAVSEALFAAFMFHGSRCRGAPDLFAAAIGALTGHRARLLAERKSRPS